MIRVALGKPTFSEEETIIRRDEVIRRMANTPPQHAKPRPQRKKKPTGQGRAAKKGRVPA